jgi:3',5'-nucleoside bisphosphate phosphatase
LAIKLNKMRIPAFLIFWLLPLLTAAQAPHSHGFGRQIVFPDVPGYQTLKCDFHQHTVFSDGSVWPDIRVEEALRDGLDAIALTDHVEYQPHKDDIPHMDRNRSYRLALGYAENSDLIVVNGQEITRDMPPGHSNAIFLQDANSLLVEDSVEVFRAAQKQGAFIFWNHPNWTAQRPDGIATLTETHLYLMAEKLLHGIEVVNDLTYSIEAVQIALDHNLTMMGTSDIHGLIDWQYKVPEGGHRPITLVFARERSADGIREALFDRRTVVYFNNLLIGRSAHLVPLIQACLTVVEAAYRDGDVLALTIENKSDAEFILQNQSFFTFHSDGDVMTIPAHSRRLVEVKTVRRMSTGSLPFVVLNGVTGPRQHAEISLAFTVR